MSPGSNLRTLLNRARKAGLSTRELYSALSTRPAEATPTSGNQVDGNGYVASVDENGRAEYRPASGIFEPET